MTLLYQNIEHMEFQAAVALQEKLVGLRQQQFVGDTLLFVEHRNDQSIFSLMRKQAGSLILPDETWFKDWDDGADFPIHARRFR
jgi:hypothetical protein